MRILKQQQTTTRITSTLTGAAIRQTFAGILEQQQTTTRMTSTRYCWAVGLDANSKQLQTTIHIALTITPVNHRNEHQPNNQHY